MNAMNKELREAVAAAIAECRTAATRRGMWNESQEHDFADAAISIIRPAVLQEAAKVAEEEGYPTTLASAIRALAKEGE